MESLVALEGLHAVKHAVRFGATLTDILTSDLDKALTTANVLAPDLRPLLEQRARVVTPAELRERASGPVHTGVLAYARPPAWTLADALPRAGHQPCPPGPQPCPSAGPTILLDDPRNSKNLGAVIRVAAATGAAGVLVHGPASVTDPAAVRGAAGLQWAVPCWGSPTLLAELDAVRTQTPFTLVGLDADGTTFDPAAGPGPTIFAFGSERTGLSEEVRTRCDAIVALPMRAHVSSLNLATAVAAVTYLRLYARVEK
ncbi:MAG: hypothetical protein LBI33_05635 [Propionibacteriaceae bacterium]|jgi:TrmH family RNA methyltransferase|nr:hypothetical protein [Propionibacteriaceae bacterium]